MQDLFRIAALGGSRALAALIGFLAVWQIADRLGPTDLGIWSVALSAMGYALHVSEWGLRSVVTAEAGAVGWSWRALVSRYLQLRSAIVAATIGVAMACVFVLWSQHWALMAILFLVPPAIALHLDWIALVHDRPLQAGLCLLVKPAAFSFVIWATPAIDSPLGIAMALAMAWWVSAAVTWPLLSWVAKHGPAPRGARSMSKLGLPLMANTLANQAQLSLDLLLVGFVAGAAMAGHYYLAAAVTAAGLVFANATGQIATARMAKFRADPLGFRNELRRHLAATLAIALAVSLGLAIVGPTFMLVVFGDQHAPTATLLAYFLPWFILASVSTHLQGALAANLQQSQINRGNCVLVAVLIPAMLFAGVWAWVPAFALARALAEGGRLIILIKAALGDNSAIQADKLASSTA